MAVFNSMIDHSAMPGLSNVGSVDLKAEASDGMRNVDTTQTLYVAG